MIATHLLYLTLALIAVALEFLTGTMVMLGAGISLFILAVLSSMFPLGTALTVAIGAISWAASTIALRTAFRKAEAPPDPNVYSRDSSTEQSGSEMAD